MFRDLFTPTEFEYTYSVQDAQAMRDRLAELKEVELEVEQQRNSTKGQAKRPFTKRLKEIRAEIDIISENLRVSPPEPLSNDAAVKAMIERLGLEESEHEKKRYSQAVEMIQDRRTDQLADWFFENLIEADYQKSLLKPLTEHTCIFDLFDAMYTLYKELIFELLRSDNLHNSTSQMHNVVNMAKHKINARLVRNELVYLLLECERLVERVKVFNELVDCLPETSKDQK